MRNVILSVALGLLAVPAMAGSIQGTWATDPQHCSGEGSTWTERAFIGTSFEDLIVYSRGVARNYARC